jgi:hypothetical protein
VCSGHNCAGSFLDLDDNVHDNTHHAQRYMYGFQTLASVYQAAAVQVSATAAVTLGSTTLTPAAGSDIFIVFQGFICNYEPNTVTLDCVVDFWIEVGGTQRTAKWPLTVMVADAFPQPFTLPLASGGIGDTAFWAAAKTTAQAVTIRAQRQANADANGLTVAITNRAFSMLMLTRDIP